MANQADSTQHLPVWKYAKSLRIAFWLLIAGASIALWITNKSDDEEVYDIVMPVLGIRPTDAQWTAYNNLLAEKAAGRLTFKATEEAKTAAWNPSSIAADVQAGAADNWVTFTRRVDIATNRSPSVMVAGNVRLKGTNAFGGVVVNSFPTACTLSPRVSSEKKEAYIYCE